jgi:hypothetical protein
MATEAAAHHWSGSCSAAPGSGRAVAIGIAASARTVSCSSMSTALTAEVPMSMPRKVTEILPRFA